MTVVLHDRTLLTGALNGELSGTARTFRLIHDRFAELIEAGCTGSSECPFDIRGFNFASHLNGCWSGGAGFEPERFRIEGERSWLGSRSVTELETEFDGRDMRRRPDQQEIGVADRVQCTGAAESAPDLMPANGFSNVVDL